MIDIIDIYRYFKRVCHKIHRWFHLDLNTYYPIRPYPRNRRERRRLEWEDEHPWTMAWKGTPGYKWREYIGPAYHALAEWYKRKRKEYNDTM